jgi:hypothetical protein
MKRPFTILFSIVLSSCNSTGVDKPIQAHRVVDTTQKLIFSKNIYLVNNGGCVYQDSIVVESIGSNLYIDKNANLYFKTYDHSNPDNELPVLISRIYNSCEGDSTYDLKNNIDVTTFKEIGYNYYTDKKKVFYHNKMSDGGNLVIADDIDVKTFKLFPKSFYAMDKKRIYYKGSIVELADRKSFECISKLNGKDTLPAWFGKDKRYYFDGGDTCSKKQTQDY